jgi:hypothetical protein
MADMRTRLQRAATEAESPEDRAWAASRFKELYGEPHDAPVERFDMRTGQRQSLDPLDAAINRRSQQQDEGPDAVESGVIGAGQGVFGLGDEIGAAGHTYGFNPAMVSGGGMFAMGDAALRNRAAGDPTGTKTYRSTVDQARGDVASAAENHPAAYYPAMLGTALLAPGPKGAPKGAGLGERLARNTAAGVASGTATGIGQSDKEDPGGIAEDALASGALGGGLGLLGTAIGAPFKYLYDKLGSSAGKRIANEAAEGATQKTTPTARAHLEKASKGLAEEVVSGPRGDEVRSALKGPAAEAPTKLKPRMDDLKAQRGAGYDAFKQAGRGDVDVDGYLARLKAKADEADEAGDTELYQAINHFMGEVSDAYQRRGSMGLERLRKMTTKTQKAAASAVGGLNLHAPAELKDRISAVATEAMDDTLSIAASGDEALEAAAASIREANRGMSPLLTAKKALKQRARKEASEGQGFRTLGKQVGMAATPAALGAVTAEEGDKLESAALYGGGALALQRALPALGGLMDRGITGAAIYAARHPNSQLPAMAGRAVRPFVPPLSLSLLEAFQRRREQEK